MVPLGLLAMFKKKNQKKTTEKREEGSNEREGGRVGRREGVP